MIDADGVAAEFITPFIGAFSDNVDFLHECTAGLPSLFCRLRVSRAVSLHRFHGSEPHLRHGHRCCEEIDDAYKHGLRAISLPGKVSFVSRELPDL